MPLYPEIEPYKIHKLPVGNGHTLYVEESGNPKGIPLLFVHGGPGGGSKPSHRQYADPKKFRIILFDQRGNGHSTYKDRFKANTTAHMVADMERIRTLLGIDKWILTATSWGSTLSLVYAQTHPQRCLGLVICAILLGNNADLRWFREPSGMAAFMAGEYAALRALLPTKTPSQKLVNAAWKLMSGSNARIANAVIKAWSRFEMAASDLAIKPEELEATLSNIKWLRAHSLLECHYHRHRWFLKEDQIIKNAGRLKKVPVHIVQGGLDLICPPVNAVRLHQALPHSKLYMVPVCGHMLTPEAKDVRVKILNQLAAQLAK